jgi:hypothetical protein
VTGGSQKFFFVLDLDGVPLVEGVVLVFADVKRSLALRAITVLHGDVPRVVVVPRVRTDGLSTRQYDDGGVLGRELLVQNRSRSGVESATRKQHDQYCGQCKPELHGIVSNLKEDEHIYYIISSIICQYIENETSSLTSQFFNVWPYKTDKIQ